MTSPALHRRTLLGGLLAGAVAGCLGGPPPAEPEEDEEVPPELQLNGVALDSAFPIELFDPETGEKRADVHWHNDRTDSHWHRLPVEVPAGGEEAYEVRINDAEIQPLPLGPDEEYRLRATVEGDTPDVLRVDVSDDLLTFDGRDPGEAVVVIAVHADGEDVWVAPDLPITVVED